MLRNTRTLQGLSGTLTDLSPNLSDIHAQTKVIPLDTGDFIYLGSDLPFNHRYFDVTVVNDQAASWTVEIWSGTQWVPVVDVIDETSVGGVTLAQSGIISWTPDPDADSWCFDDTDDMTGSGLETLKIFGLYWARLTISATIKVTTALNYVGHKFSNDSAMVAEYPDLGRSALMTSFKAGKTSWNEQHLLAAEYIVGDLRSQKNLLTSPDQILVWDNYEKAGVHRTAMLIFQAMGEDYVRELAQAAANYKRALDVGNHQIDKNGNATLEEGERVKTNVFMTR